MKNIKGSSLMSFATVSLVRAAAAALAAVVLVSCGSGGDLPAAAGVTTLRPLGDAMTTRKAVAYSPFRSNNRDTEIVTRANVVQDLGLLLAGGFNLIRMFDSADQTAKLALQVIHDNRLDIKMMLGAYVLPPTSAANIAHNNAELARAVALANHPDFRDIVVAVSVGNETMVSWSTVPIDPVTMAGYLKTVRDQIAQPVTTDDNWAFFAQRFSEAKDPKPVLAVIDFVAMHTYPLLDSVLPAIPEWDWLQQGVAAGPARAEAMMDAAIGEARRQYAEVAKNLAGLGYAAMPIAVTETGWKARPLGGEDNRAHPVNQKMYLDRLAAWGAEYKAGVGGPFNIIYFEAFDEPWKGSDNSFGLFTVGRKARYMIQNLYDPSQWDVPSVDAAPQIGTNFTTADAVSAPDIVITNVTANRYTVYSDVATTGEQVATGLGWFGFDSPPNAFAFDTPVAGATGEAANFKKITLAPNPAYGWGLLATLPANNAANLSQFGGASGRLNLRIRTRYGGKLEIGFMSTNAAGATVYASVPVSNTNADGYGFVSDGQWHDVSVPIAAMTAAAGIDLSKVTMPLVISDRFDITKNTNRGDTSEIDVDAVFWSR